MIPMVFLTELAIIFLILGLAGFVGYKYGIAAGLCAVPGITCLCLVYGFWSFADGSKLKENRNRRNRKSNASVDGLVETGLE